MKDIFVIMQFGFLDFCESYRSLRNFYQNVARLERNLFLNFLVEVVDGLGLVVLIKYKVFVYRGNLG